jgi:hypothetical protein
MKKLPPSLGRPTDIPQFPTLASLVGAAGSLPRCVTWERVREIAREDAVRSKLIHKPSVTDNGDN